MLIQKKLIQTFLNNFLKNKNSNRRERLFGQINYRLENWFINRIKKSDKTLFYKELKDVTIVIPSYSRQSYILRQLIYWVGSGVKLLILDGSPSALPKNILRCISPYQDITYLHINISFEGRLNKSLDFLKTKYIALLSDDDFFIKFTLKNLVQKLNNENDLCGCIGQSIRFNFENKKNKIVYSRGYAHQKYSATQDNIKDRLEYAMNPYNAAAAYGLIRKKVWEDGWGKIEKYSCCYVIEIFQALATYLSGKYIATDQLFWLRSKENPPISNVGWDRKFRFHQWWKNNKYQLENEKFLFKLLNIKNIKTNLERDNLKKIIISALNIYSSSQQRCNSIFKNIILKLIKLFLFLSGIYYLQQKLKKNYFSSSDLDKNLCKKFLNDYKISNELKDIEKLIEDFHSFNK
jgi:glycosyltransferase domain-containing protein